MSRAQECRIAIEQALAANRSYLENASESAARPGRDAAGQREYAKHVRKLEVTVDALEHYLGWFDKDQVRQERELADALAGDETWWRES